MKSIYLLITLQTEAGSHRASVLSALNLHTMCRAGYAENILVMKEIIGIYIIGVTCIIHTWRCIISYSIDALGMNISKSLGKKYLLRSETTISMCLVGL
jgi:hypothetical protein